ncbi:aminopeptidase M1 [Actinidia rufa]|uniref:Aminopeptidase n=1 Tax=Actinidia rufa TaxID=165716 RepID=A0A7J0GXP2_9ERIC|nr:aminopeptidase M1 [Actinidia rufa]
MKRKKYEQFVGQPRLPKFAVPKRYDIALKLDLVTCKFAGAVQISVDIVSDTNFIVLNAADLDVEPKSVRFKEESGSKVLEALEVELFEEDEIMVLEFAENLPLGVGVLFVAFEGTLNDKMKGFYRSVYEHNGEKKNMAVTHFEPADARRCFPCWDEPACKATFKITLEVPSQLVALSNMPIVEEKVDGNIKMVHYQESPIMSTYLVAIVIGFFDYVEDHTSDGIKVRIYCQVGKAYQGKFALDVAVKTLDLYKDYFAMPYPLPKLDMIAIPDFAIGAMENYGLVTYRETALLYDDKHSAAANKQRVATVVGHELAHQWFGNLVTMEWWTDLWLKEGFATWVEINHASEIKEIFDAISYRKGASIIRMLQTYLGPECLQRALASFVKKYACSNAKTEDLWAVLEEESGESVKMVMNSWTKQKGYPVVSVKVKDQMFEFEQSQFLLSGSQGNGEWAIPLTLCCGSYDTCKKVLLQAKSENIGLKELLGSSITESRLVETGAWIKLNVDQTGFYRVKYDEDLAGRLRYAIETKCLSATDRFGILDDSYALCMACQHPLASLLTLMGAFREELEYTISYKILRIAADAAPELLDHMKCFFINLFQYSTIKLGWDPKQGESHLDAMLRGELLTAMVHFGHDVTQNEARRRFDAFLNDRSTPLLPPDIRRAAYVAVMQNASTRSRSCYESLLRVYRESDHSQEKTRILGSLASCPDPGIVLEVLNFLLSDEFGASGEEWESGGSRLGLPGLTHWGSLRRCGVRLRAGHGHMHAVRSQDAIFGLNVSIEGHDTAWRWMKDSWDHISKTWGSGFLITRFVNAIVSPFSSKEKANEVEEFFASRTKPSIMRTLKQSIERVHINARWVWSIQNERYLPEVVKDLSRGKY